MPTLPRPRFLVQPSTFDAVARIIRSQHVGISIQPEVVQTVPPTEIESLPDNANTIPTEEVVLDPAQPDPIVPSPEPMVEPDPPSPTDESPSEEAHEEATVEESTNSAGTPEPQENSANHTPAWDPDMKKADLLAFAIANGVDVQPTATKAEIVAAIKAAGF